MADLKKLAERLAEKELRIGLAIDPSADAPGISAAANLLDYLDEQEWARNVDHHRFEHDQQIAELRVKNAQNEKELAQQSEKLQKIAGLLARTDDEKSKLQMKVEDLRKQIQINERSRAALQKDKDLTDLLERITERATEKLIADSEFQKQFGENNVCQAFVLSLDVRRSTDLMLRAKNPKAFASFLNKVMTEFVRIVKDQWGVVDKFTGDGLLAYFPEFFTGNDAGYRALKAAAECHAAFDARYRENRSQFAVLLKGVGIGVGIDYGEVQFLRITADLTVVGGPVVYASRLSGAPPGHTYVNQPAMAALVEKTVRLHATEVEFDLKHDGPIICQDVAIAETSYQPAEPLWANRR